MKVRFVSRDRSIEQSLRMLELLNTLQSRAESNGAKAGAIHRAVCSCLITEEEARELREEYGVGRM